MSRVLVSGCDGFIGRYVHRELEAHGHKVVGLDWRLKDDAKDNILKVDVRRTKHLNVVFESFRPQAVIHLAGQSSISRSWADAVHDADVNALGTVKLLGLAQMYGVGRFVLASTSAVYAPNGSGHYHERDRIGPQTPYGVSKAAAEQYCRISGVNCAILRLGNVYGPQQVPLGDSILIARALSWIYQREDFKINGDGEQERDYVYVQDVARAFRLAAERKIEGSYTVNIASGQSRSVNEVVERLAGLARAVSRKGIPRDAQFWPHGPAKPGELRKVEFDVRRANTMLGWTPEVSFAEGLRRTHHAWPK